MSTVPLPDDLLAALATRLRSTAPKRAAAQVERLIENYRGPMPTGAPVLRDADDVAAYAAYRMPATYTAVRTALRSLRRQAPQWTPGTHLDLGGGTGAATWAVADAWPAGGAAAHASTVMDWSRAALDLGGELARDAHEPAVRDARWTLAPLGGAPQLPESDLVTVSYLLGELKVADREALVTAAAAAARGAVLIAEPGTPDGYARIIDARDRLIAAGFRILAPCPHDAACPVTGDDWCHFAARVQRTSLHRQVKGGSLPYEDEKFSYVAAARFAAEPAAGRVVRHPQIRKGLVLLELCIRDDGLVRSNVTKRQGERYRDARDTDWGDPWPPASDHSQP